MIGHIAYVSYDARAHHNLHSQYDQFENYKSILEIKANLIVCYELPHKPYIWYKNMILSVFISIY